MSEWSLTITDLRLVLISGNLTTLSVASILGEIESALYLKDYRSGSGYKHSILIYRSLYNSAGDLFVVITANDD